MAHQKPQPEPERPPQIKQDPDRYRRDSPSTPQRPVNAPDKPPQTTPQTIRKGPKREGE